MQSLALPSNLKLAHSWRYRQRPYMGWALMLQTLLQLPGFMKQKAARRITH
jgi:hypothetical protein